MRKMIVGLAGGPVKRFIAKWFIKNKTDDDLVKLINSQKVYREKGFKAAMEKTIDEIISLNLPAKR